MCKRPDSWADIELIENCFFVMVHGITCWLQMFHVGLYLDLDVRSEPRQLSHEDTVS